mgnify:FL=1
MGKRQLTDEEQKLCEKVIRQLEKRNTLIRPKIEYYNYMISKGLHINYQEKYDEFLAIKKEINQEIFTNDLKTTQLKDQILSGVEIKEKQEKTICSECGQEMK